jgi:hypothetical protein
MIAIIEGKRYDTDTAESIAEWENAHYPADSKYCKETLYRTQKGAFFLYGEGGGLSRYAEHCEGWVQPGEKIIPISDDEARDWLMEHQLIAALAQLFPDSIEDA